MLRLAALAALCGAALGGAEGPKSPPDPEAAGQNDFRARLGEGGQLQRLSDALARLGDGNAAHRRLLTRRRGRRLFSAPSVDFGKIGDDTKKFGKDTADFADDTAKKGKDAAEDGIDNLVNIIDAAKESFDQFKGSFEGNDMAGGMDMLKKVMNESLSAATGFGTYMEGIFSNFGKVEPYFQSAFGVVPLLASEELMVTLVQTIDMLLDSSTEIQKIDKAVNTTLEHLTPIKASIDNILETLTGIGKRRRLMDIDFNNVGEYVQSFDYGALLDDLDFDFVTEELPRFMTDAIEKAGEIGSKFMEIRDVLKPIVDRLKQHYGVDDDDDAGDAPSEPTGNGTEVADERRRRMRAQLSQLQRRLVALDALGIGREMGASAWSRGLDRRLVEDVEAEDWSELDRDRGKYEGALLSVTPTWRSAETLAKDSCDMVQIATKKVEDFICRVENFFKAPAMPGPDFVDNVVESCREMAQKNVTDEGSCPVKVQSENLRESFNGSAGFISWAFAIVEYIIVNNRFLALIMALLVLIVGCVLAFMGYYIKDGVEFFQGCCGGLVMYPMAFSVLIVWTGMCRGDTFIPHCDPQAMMWTVLVLSVLTGIAAWKLNWERVEAFVSGFTTGALTAGVYYITLYRDELLGGFLDADSAKPYMLSLLVVMVLVGTIVACLTQVLFRQLMMMGTAIVGSFLIVCAFLIVFPHWWTTWDWVAWGVLAVAGYVVQLLLTPPDKEILQEVNPEEEAENKEQLNQEAAKV